MKSPKEIPRIHNPLTAKAPPPERGATSTGSLDEGSAAILSDAAASIDAATSAQGHNAVHDEAFAAHLAGGKPAHERTVAVSSGAESEVTSLGLVWQASTSRPGATPPDHYMTPRVDSIPPQGSESVRKSVHHEAHDAGHDEGTAAIESDDTVAIADTNSAQAGQAVHDEVSTATPSGAAASRAAAISAQVHHAAQDEVQEKAAPEGQQVKKEDGGKGKEKGGRRGPKRKSWQQHLAILTWVLVGTTLCWSWDQQGLKGGAERSKGVKRATLEEVKKYSLAPNNVLPPAIPVAGPKLAIQGRITSEPSLTKGRVKYKVTEATDLSLPFTLARWDFDQVPTPTGDLTLEIHSARAWATDFRKDEEVYLLGSWKADTKVLQIGLTDARSIAVPKQWPVPEQKRWLEVCAGIGGFKLGLEALGVDIDLAVEIEHETAKTYKALHTDTLMLKADLTDARYWFLFSGFTYWVGGPPCQDFSNAGEAKGWDGTTSKVLLSALLAAGLLRPEWCCFENVPPLINNERHARGLDTIVKECGLLLNNQIVNAAEFMPQVRKRAFLTIGSSENPIRATRQCVAAADYGPQAKHLGLPFHLSEEEKQQLWIDPKLWKVYCCKKAMPCSNYLRILCPSSVIPTLLRAYGGAHIFCFPWYGTAVSEGQRVRFLHPVERLAFQSMPTKVLDFALGETRQGGQAAIKKWWQLCGNTVPPHMITFVCSTKVAGVYPNMEAKVAQYCREVKKWSLPNLGQEAGPRHTLEGEEGQGKQEEGLKTSEQDKAREAQGGLQQQELQQGKNTSSKGSCQGWQPKELHKLLQKSAKAKALGQEQVEPGQGSHQKRRRSSKEENQRSQRRSRDRSASSEEEEKSDMPDCFYFTPEEQRAEDFNKFPDYAALPGDPELSPTTTWEWEYEDFQEEENKTKENTGLKGGKETYKAKGQRGPQTIEEGLQGKGEERKTRHKRQKAESIKAGTTWEFINTGGVLTQLPSLMATESNGVCAVETQATASIQRAASKQISQNKLDAWNFLWSTPKEEWEDKGHQGGFLTCQKGAQPIKGTLSSAKLQDLKKKGRAEAVRIPVAGRKRWITICLYYADVKSERSFEHKQEADACDAAWIEEACKAGDKPWLLYGDFNREEQDSHMLQQAIASGCIFNVLDKFKASKATTRQGRNIDRLYANLLGLQMIQKAEVLETASYRGCHSALQITISPGALLQKRQVLSMPAHYNFEAFSTASEKTKEQRETSATMLLQQEDTLGQNASEVWAATCKYLERVLAACQEQECEPAERKGRPGRAQGGVLELKEGCGPTDSNYESSTNMWTVQGMRTVRRMRQLHALVQKENKTKKDKKQALKLENRIMQAMNRLVKPQTLENALPGFSQQTWEEAAADMIQWIHEVNIKMQAERLPEWIRSMKQSEHEDKKYIWTWLRARTKPRHQVNVLRVGSEEFTADHAEIAQHIQDVWQPILAPAQDIPGKEPYCELLADFLGKEAWPRQTIDENMWIRLCHGIKEDTAAGSDGWTSKEIRALPPAALKVVLQAINTMMCFKELPKQWQTVLCPVLPKEGFDGEATKTRLLSLLSVWLRIWGKATFQLGALWLEKWPPAAIQGGRRGGTPARVYFQVATLAEEAMRRGQRVQTMHIDCAKYFDRLPHWLAELLEIKGVPSNTIAWMTAIRKSPRRIKVSRFIGNSWIAKCGSPQGDATAVLEAQVHMSLFTLGLLRDIAYSYIHKGLVSTLEVQIRIFMDDRTITFHDLNNNVEAFREQMQEWQMSNEGVISYIQKHDSLSNTQLNLAKSKVATTNMLTTQGLHDDIVRTQELKILGATVPFHRQEEELQDSVEKCEAACEAMRLIGTIPVSMECKTHLLGAVATSRLFGLEGVEIHPNRLSSMRTQALETLWPGKEMRGRGSTLAFLTKQWYADPCSHYIMSPFYLICQMIQRNDLSQVKAAELIQLAAQLPIKNKNIPGPFGRMIRAARALHFELMEGTEMQHRVAGKTNLARGTKEFGHWLREVIRQEGLINEARGTKKREDAKGMEQGAEVQATCALLRTHSLPYFQQYALQQLLVGAYPDEYRMGQCAGKNTRSFPCSSCGEGPATMEHLLYCCKTTKQHWGKKPELVQWAMQQEPCVRRRCIAIKGIDLEKLGQLQRMNAETVADLNQRWYEQLLETKSQSHESFPVEFPKAWNWIQTRSELEILEEVPRYLQDKTTGKSKVGTRAMNFLEKRLEQQGQDQAEERKQGDKGLQGGKEERAKEKKTSRAQANNKGNIDAKANQEQSRPRGQHAQDASKNKVEDKGELKKKRRETRKRAKEGLRKAKEQHRQQQPGPRPSHKAAWIRSHITKTTQWKVDTKGKAEGDTNIGTSKGGYTKKTLLIEFSEIAKVGPQTIVLRSRRSLRAWCHTHLVVNLHDCSISFSLWASDQVPIVGLKKSQVLRSMREATGKNRSGLAKKGLQKDTREQTCKVEFSEIATGGPQATMLRSRRSLGARRHTHFFVNLHDCSISFSLWASDQVPIVGLKKSQVLRSMREAKGTYKSGPAEKGLRKTTWELTCKIEFWKKGKGDEMPISTSRRRSLGAWRGNITSANGHACTFIISERTWALRSLRETMSSVAQRFLQKLRFVEKVKAADEVKIEDCAADSGHSAVRDCKHR
jgi:hypothetical protein